MANDLLLREPTLPGLVPSADVDRLAAMFTDALITDEGEPALPRLPTTAERRDLHNRMQELARAGRAISYAGAEQETAMKRIALLCNGWSQNRGAGTDASGLVATFLHDAMDLPLFAIMRACDDVTKGRAMFRDPRTGTERVIDPAYPVQSAQLYALASKHAARVREEAFKIGKVLQVRKIATPPASPEARARVAEGLKDLADYLKRGMPQPDPKLKDRVRHEAVENNRQQILREYAAMGIEPIYSSPGVLLSPAIARQQQHALANRRQPPQHEHEEAE